MLVWARRHCEPVASWVACGLFDGLAHEPWRHGVQPVCVVIPAKMDAGLVLQAAGSAVPFWPAE